jgi:hypothetical protein
MFAYSMREKTNAHRTLQYGPTFYMLFYSLIYTFYFSFIYSSYSIVTISLANWLWAGTTCRRR